MKRVTALLLCLGVTGSCLAGPAPESFECRLTDNFGNTSEMAFSADEASETVAMAGAVLPATFRTSAITWRVRGTGPGEQPSDGFLIVMSRYSGEIQISFVNAATGSKLVAHSGRCRSGQASGPAR